MCKLPREPTPTRPRRTRSDAASVTGSARNGDHHGNSAISAEELATTASRLRNSRRSARPSIPEEDEDEKSKSISPLNPGGKLPRVGIINNLHRRYGGEAGEKASPLSLWGNQ